MAQKEGLYSVRLFGADGKHVGTQALISARTAASGVKKAIKIHNDFSKRYGHTQAAVRGEVAATLIDGKLTRINRRNPDHDANKGMCAYCGRIITRKGGRWVHSKRSLDLQHDAKPDSRVYFDSKGYAHEKNPAKKNPRVSRALGDKLVFSPSDIAEVSLSPAGAVMISLRTGEVIFTARSVTLNFNGQRMSSKTVWSTLVKRYVDPNSW